MLYHSENGVFFPELMGIGINPHLAMQKGKIKHNNQKISSVYCNCVNY